MYIDIVVGESLGFELLPDKVALCRALVQTNPAFKFLFGCHCSCDMEASIELPVYWEIERKVASVVLIGMWFFSPFAYLRYLRELRKSSRLRHSEAR